MYTIVETSSEVAGAITSPNLTEPDNITDLDHQASSDHGLHNPILFVSIKINLMKKLKLSKTKLLFLQKIEKTVTQETNNPSVSNRWIVCNY